MGGFDELIKEAEKNIIANLESKGFDIGQSESLQRTEEWFKQREGKFTGSEIYKLMGVDRSFSKFEWGSPEKLIAFNEVAKKYIFSKAMERKRGKVIRKHLGKAAHYGVEQESIITQMLIEKGFSIKEVGFIEFIKDIAGASPDGLVDGITALEIKASTDWDTLYSRHMIPFTAKHGDFWQIQAEMLALKVEKCMYVVAEASEDMYEPNITDLSIQTVDASPIHQEALIQRCMIGNDAILRYLSGVEFHEAVRQACTEYKTPGNTCNNEHLIEKAVKQHKIMPFESGDKPKFGDWYMTQKPVKPETPNQVIETQEAIIRAKEARLKDIDIPF